MGVVYEAEQISLGRRVALKVLPFAAALDPRQLQRFKNEAQAAACLHHTNIVPVYGVGCERGVHYYAMQFIEGQTLAAIIEDLRGGKRSRLDRARLRNRADADAALLRHRQATATAAAAGPGAAARRRSWACRPPCAGTRSSARRRASAISSRLEHCSSKRRCATAT